MPESRVALAHTEDFLRAGEHVEAPAPAGQKLTVTLVLRRPAGAVSAEDLLAGRYQFASRAEAETQLAANPADIEAVAAYARAQGLTITREDPASRRILVEGTAAQLSSAFGVQLETIADAAGHHFVGYQGAVQLPANIAPLVTAVLGLSQRTVAVHH